MSLLNTFFIVLLIFGIMYTLLTLYFEHRMDKKYKEWLKRNQQYQNSKKI
jgi:antibiotic biosynthesis monooxygenase (ABM) superfamily enzyme